VDHFRLRMAGKKDRNGDDYYVLVTKLPANLDLSNTLFILFPFEEDDGQFGADLVIRSYDGKDVSISNDRQDKVKRG